MTEGPALLTREVYLQYWLMFSLFPAANFTEMNHNTDGLGPVWMTASGCPSKILVGRLACVWFTAKKFRISANYLVTRVILQQRAGEFPAAHSLVLARLAWAPSKQPPTALEDMSIP